MTETANDDYAAPDGPTPTVDDLAAEREFVRVKDGDAKITVTRAFAESADLDILDESAYHPTNGRLLDVAWEGDPDWEPEQPDAAPATAADDLKGAALDKALKDAGLPVKGTADEKRASYAEWQTQQQAAGGTPAGEQ